MLTVKKRKPHILTKDVLAKIPAMVASGEFANRQAIADALGCNLATLQVRCSQNGISLRQNGRLRSGAYALIRLNREAAAMLRERASQNGETEQELARRLIETIARDDLYDAVLDDDKAAA